MAKYIARRETLKRRTSRRTFIEIVVDAVVDAVVVYITLGSVGCVRCAALMMVLAIAIAMDVCRKASRSRTQHYLSKHCL